MSPRALNRATASGSVIQLDRRQAYHPVGLSACNFDDVAGNVTAMETPEDIMNFADYTGKRRKFRFKTTETGRPLMRLEAHEIRNDGQTWILLQRNQHG